MHDFYVFNNIIKALNYEKADFENFDPVSAEEMWHGVHLLNKFFPNIEISGEARIFIKHILTNEGVYFLPEFMEGDFIHKVKERAQSGPFPLGESTEDFIGRQAAFYLVYDTYHKIESTKNLSWITNKSE